MQKVLLGFLMFVGSCSLVEASALVPRKAEYDYTPVEAYDVVLDLMNHVEGLKESPDFLFGNASTKAIFTAFFMRCGMELNNLTDQNGMTLLMHISSKKLPQIVIEAYGKREVLSPVELLILHGAKVNYRERETGKTALHYAAAQGRTLNARTLVFRCADRRAKDKDGNTPADLARKNGHNDLAEFLDVPPTSHDLWHPCWELVLRNKLPKLG